MTDIPGFSPKSMSDDELASKAEQLAGKLNAARGTMSGGGADYLQLMLDALQQERTDRLLMAVWKSQERHLNKIIDTDGPTGASKVTPAGGDKGGKQPGKALPWKKTARPVAPQPPDPAPSEPDSAPTSEENKP